MIELLIVIAIIGILAITIAPKLLKEIRKGTVAKVQHNLGIIRSRLSLDESLSDEFPDLANEEGRNITELLKAYSINPTPPFADEDGNSYKESSEIVDFRDNTGGWYYIRKSGEIYANLPDGAYTKDDKYEIWRNGSNSVSYDFTDIDDFTTKAASNIDGWSTVDGNRSSITSNPYDEYTIESTVTFTGDTAGYGIYIQSDEDSNGYILQYDRGYAKKQGGALIIRKRVTEDAYDKDGNLKYNSDGSVKTKINEGAETITLAKTKDNEFMTENWWEKEHDIQINVTDSTTDNSKQNVEIIIDDTVITNDTTIDKSDTDNYTGIRTWNTSNTIVDVDSVNITEL
ncbi:MAG: hypothetical protein B6227_06460 [Fusobacteriia bacterium 4572_74]|nr:MAG: hypothetical protein B6227_06460 [Fusobacteriia bacterium 4572_74]